MRLGHKDTSRKSIVGVHQTGATSNHDILMGLVAKRVADRRLRRLIRGFLTAGVLADGLVGPTDEGTPQGGPLTPPTILQNCRLIPR